MARSVTITAKAIAIFKRLAEAEAKCACEDNDTTPSISAEDDGPSLWYHDGQKLFDRLARAAGLPAL
jgi:hypothetical protein